MPAFNSYIICTSPRSGSTLLCGLLAATGRAGNPDSHFHNPSVSDWLRDFDLSPDPSADERSVLRAVFDAARARGTGDTGVFGLRLQRNSFAYFTRKLDVLHPGLASDAARFRAEFGDTLFLHLSRESKLEQAVSLVRATQSGLWHRAPDGTELERLSPPRKPVYDAAEIARQMADLTALDQGWADWFAEQRIEPLRLRYEALSADPAGVLAGVLDRLGVDRAAAKGIIPAVAKLADATSRRWMERFLAENDGKAGSRS